MTPSNQAADEVLMRLVIQMNIPRLQLLLLQCLLLQSNPANKGWKHLHGTWRSIDCSGHRHLKSFRLAGDQCGQHNEFMYSLAVQRLSEGKGSLAAQRPPESKGNLAAQRPVQLTVAIVAALIQNYFLGS